MGRNGLTPDVSDRLPNTMDAAKRAGKVIAAAAGVVGLSIGLSYCEQNPTGPWGNRTPTPVGTEVPGSTVPEDISVTTNVSVD